MTQCTVDPATITHEMASQIRTWRVDGDLTWRSVAQAATDLWGADWGGNQIYGRDLCVVAAKMMGEDPDQKPWN
ncbi:hypothetical protein [Streptomyces sp. MOE7]|uniref:hypothetical protein n=1 Tax=Streptomyces sp. MOE7 TaxID=1961713 RepID=UPI000A0489BF|nr:hypothetical protein [Streptomyces sp. MOE7]ARH89021.1 hypothetical protein STRMOE7_00170 [Streptomyces sp. MOE7]